jgi:O-acetylserine/cysteine efflux transporter
VGQGAALKAGDIAAILLVIGVWGINFVVMKVGLASFTPFQLGAGRFLFAFLPLALVLRPPATRARWVFAFGLTQGIGQFGFLFLALQVGMTAALASVLLQTQVFFSAFLGASLLRERIGTGLKLGMLFAGVGLACFAALVWLARANGPVTGWGLALTLLAAMLWAVSNIVVRKARQEATGFAPLSFVVWSSGVSVLPFAALSWLFDPPGASANWSQAQWQAWAAIAFLGWAASDLGYSLWTGLLKRFPASRVAPFSLGVPVIGLLAGIALLHEPVAPLQWSGALFVLAALASVMLAGRAAALAAWLLSALPGQRGKGPAAKGSE